MFKRVDRRRKRKEEEETLGLDEEMKDVLGLQDTDSSESESDASSSSSASSSSASARGRKTQAARSTKKRKRRDAVSSANKDEDNDSDASNDEDEDEGEDAQTADDAESDFSVTIASALREPVRLIIAEPEAWICAICPNKTLKHSVMVKVHEGSRFHQRRFKRIQELAMGVDPDDDLQILLDKLGAEGRPKADEAALSHRAEKRKAKQAKMRERRSRIKEKKAAAIAAKKAKKEDSAAEAGADQKTTAGTRSGEEARPKKRRKSASDENSKLKDTEDRESQATRPPSAKKDKGANVHLKSTKDVANGAAPRKGKTEAKGS